MVGWHHWLNGYESEQTLGDGEGQGSLAYCSPWGHKESDMTEQLNNKQHDVKWILCCDCMFESHCSDPYLLSFQPASPQLLSWPWSSQTDLPKVSWTSRFTSPCLWPAVPLSYLLGKHLLILQASVQRPNSHWSIFDLFSSRKLPPFLEDPCLHQRTSALRRPLLVLSFAPPHPAVFTHNPSIAPLRPFVQGCSTRLWASRAGITFC